MLSYLNKNFRKVKVIFGYWILGNFLLIIMKFIDGHMENMESEKEFQVKIRQGLLMLLIMEN